MVDSKLSSLSCMCFCCSFVSIGPNRLVKCFTHTSPFWMGRSSCFCLFSVFQFSQNLFVFMDSSMEFSWFLTCWSLFCLTVFLYCFNVSEWCRRVFWLSGSLCFWFDRFLSLFLRFLHSLSNHLSWFLLFLFFCLFETFRFDRDAERSNILLMLSTALFTPSVLCLNVFSRNWSKSVCTCCCLIAFWYDSAQFSFHL